MRIAVIPGVLALLPEYAGQVDPVPELRAACVEAARWLGPSSRILADVQGARVARSLLAEESQGRVEGSQGRVEGSQGRAEGSQGRAEGSYLVVANGSARRTDASPGPYDERAVAFDEALGKALKDADVAALAGIDQDLARELWAATTALPDLAALLAGTEDVSVDYEDAPFGVSYWVVRYENAGR